MSALCMSSLKGWAWWPASDVYAHDIVAVEVASPTVLLIPLAVVVLDVDVRAMMSICWCRASQYCSMQSKAGQPLITQDTGDGIGKGVVSTGTGMAPGPLMDPAADP